MKHRSTWIVAFVGLALLASACSSPDSVTTPDTSQTQASVGDAATVAASAGPIAGEAGRITAGLVASISTASAPPPPSIGIDVATEGNHLSFGAAAPSPGPGGAAVPQLSCSAEFALANGLVGTCSISEAMVVTIHFGGQIGIDGLATTVEGILTATPAAQQPSSGVTLDVVLDATASNASGTADWHLTGTVTLEGNNQVTDFDLQGYLTIVSSGGASRMVTVRLMADQILLTVETNFGRSVRFALVPDPQGSGASGIVTMDDVPVAEIVLHDGCADVNYLNPTIEDRSFCRGI